MRKLILKITAYPFSTIILLMFLSLNMILKSQIYVKYHKISHKNSKTLVIYQFISRKLKPVNDQVDFQKLDWIKFVEISTQSLSGRSTKTRLIVTRVEYIIWLIQRSIHITELFLQNIQVILMNVLGRNTNQDFRSTINFFFVVNHKWRSPSLSELTPY